MIEVEKMVKFADKTKFEAFLAALKTHGATDLGENNTENTFYLGDGLQVKVAKLLSKSKAKIALKPRELGADFSREIEVHFDLSEAENAEKMMDILLADQPKLPTKQDRHDYLLDGVEIAAKYSEDWGYHAEMECMVEAENDIEAALETIAQLAKKLGVTTMTKEEARDHIQKELARKGF